MKRLLKISLDLALLSFIPIISWFLLSIIIDKNLINIFTLTYPVQFISYILRSIFSTGANISKEKDKNENAVMSGIFLGVIVSIFIFCFILFNIDSYINFMSMDIKIYKIFTIYSVIEIFLQTILMFILDKLYYEEENVLANKYSFIFNCISLFVLVFISLITKNQVLIITVTLFFLSVFVGIIFFKAFKNHKFKFSLNLLNCIKYNSVELSSDIFLLLVYLFGFSNTFEFGEKYVAALTFATLITDTQWDTFNAITTVAQIDISKGNFNYKEHRKNAYKLVAILLGSVFLLFITLCWFYKINYFLTILYLLFDVIVFLISPLYDLKISYLQIEWSAVKTTINELISSIVRSAFSFVKSPFCTSIGMLLSSAYSFITINGLFYKYYKINNDGFIEKRPSQGTNI